MIEHNIPETEYFTETVQYYIDGEKVTAKQYCEAFNTHYFEEHKEANVYKLTFSLAKQKNVLRTKRKNIFIAFDVYKQNVNYGIITETKEEHQKILDWYQDMRELKESAFSNIPEGVSSYINQGRL